MKLTDIAPFDSYGTPVKHVYLEYVGENYDNVSGKSNKFWEGATFALPGGRHVFVRRWGKYGAKGQTKEQTFYSSSRAEDELLKVARSKRDKGYTKEIDVVTRLSTLVDD